MKPWRHFVSELDRHWRTGGQTLDEDFKRAVERNLSCEEKYVHEDTKTRVQRGTGLLHPGMEDRRTFVGRWKLHQRAHTETTAVSRQSSQRLKLHQHHEHCGETSTCCSVHTLSWDQPVCLVWRARVRLTRSGGVGWFQVCREETCSTTSSGLIKQHYTLGCALTSSLAQPLIVGWHLPD